MVNIQVRKSIKLTKIFMRENLLIIRVSSLMVFAITNCGEFLKAEFALIRFFACVSSHMYEEISFLRKDLSTVGNGALKEVLSTMSGFYM